MPRVGLSDALRRSTTVINAVAARSRREMWIRDLRIGRLRSNRISNRIGRIYRLTCRFYDGPTIGISIPPIQFVHGSSAGLPYRICCATLNETKEVCGTTDSSFQSSNTLNNTGVWSLIELASLYTSVVNGLTRLTTTSNEQERPNRKFLNRPITFESNESNGRFEFEFESNLEASQVPTVNAQNSQYVQSHIGGRGVSFNIDYYIVHRNTVRIYLGAVHTVLYNVQEMVGVYAFYYTALCGVGCAERYYNGVDFWDNPVLKLKVVRSQFIPCLWNWYRFYLLTAGYWQNGCCPVGCW